MRTLGLARLLFVSLVISLAVPAHAQTDEEKKALEEIDKKNQLLVDEYDKAFDALKKQVDEKAKAAPPAS